MKAFRFQQFEIKQSPNVFRVGTDGVLLGAMCDISGAKNILEIGTGTGLISLMLAQRNRKAEILAIDINPEAVILAKENFAQSPFSERMKVELADFKTF
ncbi:MAG: methyltransferase domain-containing protein, partial [Cruoricaptor ignavus]|nr:methyltransferase domain-containing protein [Cruoricaptor ignavus]